MTKFHGNILNLSENIAKSFRGLLFFDSHCIWATLVFFGDCSSKNEYYCSFGEHTVSKNQIHTFPPLHPVLRPQLSGLGIT